MQNKKSLTQVYQQHQNIVQEVDQILQEKSIIPSPEQLPSVENNYYPSIINVSFTGIKEFDKLIDGGFTKGSIVLLAGSSGSGKTIFSFQWLFEGIKNNENGIYITLTEPLFKTLENLEKLSFYNKEAIENEKLRIVDLREVCGKEGFDQQKILDFIEGEVKRTNAKRLCIDSITAIAYQLDDRAKIRAFIFALGTALATLGCTTVLTSEVSEMNKYSKYEVEEFISDAILRFDQIEVKDEPQRIMRIIKVRGRKHRSDDIYFKITKDGINIFPKLRVPLEHFSTTERISMGISALDDMLGGGIFVGSSTLITGSPGTGKSTLGLSFLADGLKNGETCLYAGFEESKKQVLRNAKNFGWDFGKYEREGLLVMRCIYPNEKHFEEHLADIKQIVEEKKIKRCVVDPLSAISSVILPDAFISFSKRLNGYLKTREVTPLFISTTTSLMGDTKDVNTHLSTVSDNIILLRYVEMNGDVQCVINIIKMRGSEHSKSLRIYNITDKGVVVGNSLEGYEGVTTGVSKKIAELEKESKELKEIIKQKEMAENAVQESEEKIKQQNVQLEKLNQIKSDFFEVTSREIRSPLTTIKGYMQMLSNRAFGEITDEQKKYLEIMLRNTNRLDNLVSDLVDISRIESGSMTFTSKKTIVSKMVNEAVEKMQSSANEKNIAVNVEIEDQIPDLIVDQDRIKQVIINILGNAIKSSPDKTTVNLRAKKQEIDVLFEIQDQGISIPKDKQKKIFNAFYRADEGKSKEYSGGGIRLALSRGIVTIHGGKIWMESEEGKGNTFRFTLPIKPIDNIQTRCKESDIFGSKKDDENTEIN